MKIVRILSILSLLLIALTTGCSRSSGEVWDDTRTATRYVGRSFRSLGGKHGDSRQLQSRAEFTSGAEEFIPLNDGLAQNNFGVDTSSYVQAKTTPGEPGSTRPGINAFSSPEEDQTLATIFKNLHFAYNSSLIKGEENMRIVRNIVNYMQERPETAIFIEGHCDERGPQAFNLALGSRRANNVRNLLIQMGTNLDNIYTISYGKERPLILSQDKSSWRKNRRAKFKIHRS